MFVVWCGEEFMICAHAYKKAWAVFFEGEKAIPSLILFLSEIKNDTPPPGAPDDRNLLLNIGTEFYLN